MKDFIEAGMDLQNGDTFTYHFGAAEIRGYMQNDEVWFVAKDLCAAIDLVNPTESLKAIPADELASETLRSGGQNREMNLISESGAYRLMFRSNKPKAEPFVCWVTHEVLPSIRRQGAYKLEQQVQDQKDKALSAYEWYFEARKECKNLEERYRKSHRPLSEYETAQIKTLLRQGRSTGEIAARVERSANTVRKIRKFMKGVV